MQHFTAMQYLMIDIANAYGLDKANWDLRLNFVETNEANLENLTKQAEEPAQFLAAVGAYRKAQRGEPIGYLCGLDATASGLQLLSILAGDEQAAKICNVVSTGRREDAYTQVHERVCAITGSVHSVLRRAVKSALMTHLFGSKLEPLKAFGEDTPELKAFYQAIDELLPGADMLNRDLISLWNPDAYVHSWILPDGFDVVVKVMDSVKHPVQFLGETYEVIEKANQPKSKGLSMGANIIHSLDGMVVREMNRRCNYDVDRINALYAHLIHEQGMRYTLRAKDLDLLRILELFDQTNFMSAVVIEYLDQYNSGHLDSVQKMKVMDLIQDMPKRPFNLLCIHDCFKFHPNYGNDVRQQYINILAEIANSEILSSIATQVRGIPTQVNKLSNNLPTLIRQSEYALS